MKKIIFSILVFSACALAVQAQSSGCAKSCAAKSASCHSKVAAVNNYVPAEHQAAAAKLASTQRTIEERKSENGVAYVRRVNEGGTVIDTDVTYDAVNNQFVNVSPSDVSTAAPAAGCGPAKATAAKSGCSSAAAGKTGCCASKAKTTTASNTTNATEGKPVKTSGGTN